MAVDQCQRTREAIRIIEADFQRSVDTRLIPPETSSLPGIELYFKDEPSHPTDSLKHRLVRSLFLYALCNGQLRSATPVIEALNGSTATSGACLTRLLDLPFIAVIPANASREKITQIALYGGQSHLVEDSTQVYAESEYLARENGGRFIDQFTYTERAIDWRVSNNIVELIFQQMHHRPYPTLTWLVSNPGTGGTLTALGCCTRYRQRCTWAFCTGAERSVFSDAYVSGDRGSALDCGSRIKGIGRPRVEVFFLSEVIGAVVKAPGAWSLAAMHYLARRPGRRVGGSSGTNLINALVTVRQMVTAGERGLLVTILCGDGECYVTTYYDPVRPARRGYVLEPLVEAPAVYIERDMALPDGLLVVGL